MCEPEPPGHHTTSNTFGHYFSHKHQIDGSTVQAAPDRGLPAADTNPQASVSHTNKFGLGQPTASERSLPFDLKLNEM